MNLKPILHALAWTLYLKIANACEGQDSTRSKETLEVFDRSVFMHCQNFDDYDRAFAIMTQQGLLSEREIQTDREFITYDLVLEAETLSKHLDLVGVLDVTRADELIGCFLTLASTLGKYPPVQSDQSMPVERDAAPFPSHFAYAVEALKEAGFCSVSNGSVMWLPKIYPLMNAEGLWIGEVPAHELRKQQLMSIWLGLPAELKKVVQDEHGYVNPLSLWVMAVRHWDSSWGRFDDPTLRPIECGMWNEMAELLNSGAIR